LSDHGQLLARKDTPTGVLWRVQNERTRFLAEGRAQFVCIERPGWRMQGHANRYSVCHQDVWYIRIVEWLDHNYLVTGIDKSQDGREDAFSRPRRDNYTLR